ncbi:hypothetical protein NDU88_005975 [Pleurodeles waltl]|uniref:Uncharacterized protein n=1 Tax=Pleurodeles waltl TaxID=8319 RepID=A0AAV7SN80_PLEWA|nr:hypothetical protein NDU88_005975 [Pleurodeles waltl]
MQVGRSQDGEVFFQLLRGAPSWDAVQKQPQRQTDPAVLVGAAGASQEAGGVLVAPQKSDGGPGGTRRAVRCKQDGGRGSDARIASVRRDTDRCEWRGATL